MAQIDEIKAKRLETIENLRKEGINPFPAKYDKQQMIGETLAMEGKSVKTAGKVMSMRTHGNIAFADLKDNSGKIQLFFNKKSLGNDQFKAIQTIDTGDIIGVEGKVMKTSAGEISIEPTDWKLLTKALLPIPDEFYGLKDVETRYRKRYLDLLLNPQSQEVFRIRSKVVQLFREYLDSHGFVEVETPILQPLYGGTTAKPFTTHHNALDVDFYLRIAVELYLKRLVVGGYEKVYEIGKNFRNEGFSRQHNPEFTMLEFYWAYADYNDLMDLTEDMLSSIVKEVKGTYTVSFEGNEYDFTPGWERKPFATLYKEYLDIDINELNTEEKFSKVVKERNLLNEEVIGYGFMLDEVYKKNIRPKLKGPLFVTDYPVELKPLAKRSEEDSTKAAAFQLLVDGVEILNAYNELNDPIDQRNRWLEDMEIGERGGDEYQILDEEYIEALSYGMPPTAGWGLGIDRFVAFLTDQHAVKDVILFPTMRPLQSEKDSESRDQGKKKQTNIKAKPDKGRDAHESLTLTRDQALEIVHTHLKNKNLINHCKAVEATMGALAERLNGNVELWKMAGLLHDADWEDTQNDPKEHTLKTIEWIENAGESSELLKEGILSHNHHHNGFREPQTLMEWALYTCDELTGFIVAVALTRSDKKLASVEVESVLKKFPAKAFAKPVDRAQIQMCEEKLGIPLKEFVALTLSAMQNISDELGL